MKDLLISIKPKYVKEILLGNKTFEFRKKIFKEEVRYIYIYSTSPQKMIVARFEYGGAKESSPEKIWEETWKKGGINKLDYFDYFSKSKKAYAIKISKLEIFNREINPYKLLENFRPPQSYYYINGELNEKLCNLV